MSPPKILDPFADLGAAGDAAPYLVAPVPSAASSWRRCQLALLTEATHGVAGWPENFVALADCPVWYSLQQIHELKFCAPDFFLVFGAINQPNRNRWITWNEGGKYPDVIIDLLSPDTAVEDRAMLKQVYERTFKTDEYFLYDPETRQLDGWHLVDRRYQRIEPDARGWLWCEQLKLWLGTWEGPYQSRPDVWLRYYDGNGKVVPLFAEAEKQRAEAEKHRAEQLESELSRLRALVGEKRAAETDPA